MLALGHAGPINSANYICLSELLNVVAIRAKTVRQNIQCEIRPPTFFAFAFAVIPIAKAI
jgi:hypothetical protein